MGGAEIFTYENVRRWVKAGHEVTLFTSQFPHCRREEVVEGVRIVRAGGKYSIYWKARNYYRDHFSKDSYDVVVDEINTRPFLTPKFVKNGEEKIALIHQLAREYWLYETPFPLSYIGYYYLEKRWLKNYVDVPAVAVSESTRHDLMELGFKDVFVVPEGLNFTPLNHVPEKENYPVIMYAGRLKRAKRPDHAVKAFVIIKGEIPKAELWVVGDGYFRKDLEKIAIDDVWFFGSISNRERRELMKRAWILVNPSVREGFGLNVVEANALGTPCVAYDVAGLRDSVKDDETGLLAEAGSVEDLADKIVRILQDNTLRERMTRRALAYSMGFSWDESAEAFLRVIRCVVDG